MPDSALETAVSLSAVQAQFGEEFDEPELTQVKVWIERARDEMLTHAPSLNADLGAGRLTVTRVRGVGCDVVIRAVEDSRIGHRVRQTQFPDLTTLYDSAAGSSIYLTADEIARLQPTLGGAEIAPTDGVAYVVSLSG